MIATGLARGIDKDRRAAFGDSRKIRWGPYSAEIFRGNPRIARPGEERAGDLKWIAHYKGNRVYNTAGLGRWIWNYRFKVEPGEIFFDAAESDFRDRLAGGFVLIEPNLPWHKPIAVNKDWGEQRFQAVADALLWRGVDVVQFSHGKRRLAGVRAIETPTFRHALAALSRARFAILPEGGLHHGAAALGVPAIVLFGHCVPPSVMGYRMHKNLVGDATDWCGLTSRCEACAAAMRAIDVERVLELAGQWLK